MNGQRDSDISEWDAYILEVDEKAKQSSSGCTQWSPHRPEIDTDRSGLGYDATLATIMSRPLIDVSQGNGAGYELLAPEEHDTQRLSRSWQPSVGGGYTQQSGVEGSEVASPARSGTSSVVSSIPSGSASASGGPIRTSRTSHGVCDVDEEWLAKKRKATQDAEKKRKGARDSLLLTYPGMIRMSSLGTCTQSNRISSTNWTTVRKFVEGTLLPRDSNCGYVLHRTRRKGERKWGIEVHVVEKSSAEWRDAEVP